MARVGLPVFTVIVAYVVSTRTWMATAGGLLALYVLAMSLATGERINFLILICGGMLAGLVWRPKPGQYLGFTAATAAVLGAATLLHPGLGQRYTSNLVRGATDFETSAWWHTLNGGWVVAKDNWLTGIGTGNYRNMALRLLEDVPFTKYDPHPHNYYLQLLVETGIIGLVLGTVFLFSMVWACLVSGLRNQENIVKATAFVVPFGLFWPIATTADFFGQWNNIFTWSAVALALCSSRR